MTAKPPPQSPPPDGDVRDWLRNLDSKLLACRQRHKFPELDPTKPLPRGAQINGPYDDGTLVIVFSCLRGCGATRHLRTAPGGHELDLAGSYRYRYANSAYRAPRGAGHQITPRACLAESWRRGREAWLTKARPVTPDPAR